MRYLLDTVALVRHFTGCGKIGKKAARLLDTVGENEHDAVEKILKAVYVEKKDENVPRSHNLPRIAKAAGLTVPEVQRTMD